MATGNAKRLVEIGVPPRLAREYAAQITAGAGNTRRLIELGVMPGSAKRLAAYFTSGTVNRAQLVESGMIPRVVVELIAQRGSGGSGSIVAPTFEAGANALFNAMAADATPMPDRRKYFSNRHDFKRPTAALLAKIAGLYVTGGQSSHSVAADKYNYVNPTGPKLTNNGAATRELRGWSYTAVAQQFDTGIPFSALSANAGLLVFQESVFTASNNAAMGAQDGTGGLSLVVRQTTTANTPIIRAFGTAVGGNPTLAADRPAGSYFNGTGLTGFQRIDANTVEAYHNGELIGTYASAYVAPSNPSTTIKLGGDGVTTSPSVHSAYVILNQPLTQAEHRLLHACIRSRLEAQWWGEPLMNDVGIGANIVNADVIVLGMNNPACAAARRAARRGRTVAMVGDHFDYGPGQLGGLPAGGLGYVDVQDKTTLSGYYRALEIHIRTTQQNNAFSPADANVANSFAPNLWSNAIRASLDSTRTSTITGFDVPVYLSQGIASVQKTGNKITSITMVDGRVLVGKQFVFCDYAGHSVKLSGASFIQGMEASGTGTEAKAGFRTDDFFVPNRQDTGYAFTVDPYVTPGNAGSGLIFPLRALPSLAEGAADPTGLQSFNFRFTRTNSLTRWSSRDVSPPPGYDATKYEYLGRIFAANVAGAQGNIPLSGTFFQTGGLNDGATFDFNNGLNFHTTNYTGSGELFAQATTYAQEQQVIADTRNYAWGLFYWLKKSGDSRIQSTIITGLSDTGQYVWDVTQYCDPGDDTYINLPTRPYIREPKYRLRRAGYIFTADDAQQVDGQTPRLGANTATCASYFVDRHSPRATARNLGSGMQMVYQRITAGSTPAAGGVDQRSPIPAEIMMADPSEITNALFVTAPSITALAWGQLRMEPALTMFGDSAGELAVLAIENNANVQSFDPTTFRTRATDTTASDGYPLVLPTTT